MDFENSLILVASALVLLACATVMVVIFIGLKTIIFMHRAKLGLQTASESPLDISEKKEATKKEKPKKEKPRLVEKLSELSKTSFQTKKVSKSVDNGDSEQEEAAAAGADEPQDVGNDFEDHGEVVSEQGRGYQFNFSFDNNDIEETNDADELELCREIERLSDKINELAKFIEIELIGAQGIDAPHELIEREESEELPAGASELQGEVNRLKNKINNQIDYIEEAEEKQPDNENNDNNKNEDLDFLTYVANAFNNMQQNDLVYKPTMQRGNQDFTYVSSKEFFEFISGKMPGYKRKSLVDELKQQGIIDGSESGYYTSYNQRRVLKVYSNQFLLLTTEIKQDVGA